MTAAMSRTMIICGYGPGISAAVARKFGSEGYQLALVARSADKLEAGVAALREAGVSAKAFPCDLADPDAVTRMVAEVREQLGPIHTLHWNAYASGAGDLTSCDVAELRRGFDVAVTGAVAAVQQALPDLERQGGAVLITGGGFSQYSDQVDQMVGQWNAMGLALMKAAQHKLTGLLHHKLEARGVYVGSVVVMGMVEGTAFARGGSGLDPNAIAAAFWQLAQTRDAVSVNFAG